MVCSFVVAGPAASEAGVIPLPSGRSVAFHDTIWGAPGPAGLTVRFRFIEAELARVRDTLPYPVIEADMAYLCASFALDRISNIGPQPAQVVISISEAPVEFGAADFDVAQIFEAYRPEGENCIWEGF